MKRSAHTWRGVDSLRDKEGVYSFGGRRYLSVTNALGLLSDMSWPISRYAAQEVAAMAVLAANGEAYTVPGTEESVSPLGFLTDESWVANAGHRKMMRAAERGTVVSALAQEWACGLDIDESQIGDWMQEYCIRHELRPEEGTESYLRTMLRFLDESGIGVIATEVPVFSDSREYAGRLDLIATLPGYGRYANVVDIKTGDSFRRSWVAQLAAYAESDFYIHGDDEFHVQQETPTGLGGIVVQVLPDRYIVRDCSDLMPQYMDGLFLPCLSAALAHKNLPLPLKGKHYKEAVHVA